MKTKHKVEIFTANCSLCDDTVEQIGTLSCCEGCDIEVVDINEPAGANKAKGYGVARVPAIAVDGRLLECCRSGAFNKVELEKACS